MKRAFVLTLFFCACAASVLAQPSGYADSVAAERAALDAEFADPKTSLLDPRVQAVFEGLPYFSIDPAYRVEAVFTPTPSAEPFTMATSTGTEQVYMEEGVATFRLGDTELVLHAYRGVPSNSDSLFLPFRDATTGRTTYGGGRYLYAFPPEGDRIVLDFNTATNPYCAYNVQYACPLPPPENTLAVPVEAGVKAPPLAWLDLLDAPLPEEWSRVVSPEGSFAVAMPYQPVETKEQTPGGVRVEMVQLDLGDVGLFGASVGFPRMLTAEEQAGALEAGIAQGVSQGGTLVERTATTVAGFPGERVVIATDVGPIHAIVFVTGTHLATFTATPAEADRFFDSVEWLVEQAP